jgi:hypothetical protein
MTTQEALRRLVNETYEAHHTPSSESGPEEWDYTLSAPSIEAVQGALAALAALGATPPVGRCAECEFHRGDPRGVPPHDHEHEVALAVAPPATGLDELRDTLAAWLWQFNDIPGDGEPTSANRRKAEELLKYLRACRLTITALASTPSHTGEER